MSALLAPLPPVPPPALARWPRPAPEFAGERWTVAEFNGMANPEQFEGRRLFLLRGEIWEQGRMNPPHAVYLEHAHQVLRDIFPARFRARCQLSFLLADATELFPDVVIVTGSIRTFLTAHPTTADLIVEVSDSSLFFDSTTTAELYAAAGVPDYWVLDVNRRELHVFRDPQPVADNGFAYRWSQTFPESDTVSPLAAPTATLRVADLLP